MLDIIQSWIINNGISIATILALGLAIKNIPNMIEVKALKAVDDLFEKGGPAEDKLLIAVIQYAEDKYGPGTGIQKANYVVDRVVSMIPIQYRLFITNAVKNRAKVLVQECYDRFMAAIVKKKNEHQG